MTILEQQTCNAITSACKQIPQNQQQIISLLEKLTKTNDLVPASDRYVSLDFPEAQWFMQGGQYASDNLAFDPDKNIWFIPESEYLKATAK